MQPDDPRLKNLKPYQKGQSGNLAGLPKGYVRASTLLNKFLKVKIEVREGGKILKKEASDVIAMKAIHDAVSSTNSATERTQARESIYSRIEGRPVQPIGRVIEPEIILNISPTEAML